MASSTLGQQDAAREPGDGRYRYGYRRHFPFWLIFLAMFLLFRPPFFWWGYGGYGPGVPAFLAVIPLIVLGFFVLRFALPALDDAVRPLFRRRAASVEPDDAARSQQLELDLIDAHRRIKELEEKVAWQSKLLEPQPVTPAVGPEPPR